MLLDDAEHGLDVVLGQRLGHMRATGVAIALEGAHDGGEFGRLLVGVAGHDRGNRPGQRAAFVRIVGQAVAHDERAEVGVAQAEGAEDVGVLRDFLGRIAGVIHQDFLRGDENPHGGLEPLDIERAVLALELHQVQRGEVAGGVVEEDVFRAGIGGVNRLGAFAGVPFLDGAVVLQARVAADPGALGDLVQQRAGVLLLAAACRW